MSQTNVRRGLGLVFVLAVLAVIVISLFAGFIIDYLWFNALDYSSVFWKILTAKFSYFFLFTLVGFGILCANLLLAFRGTGSSGEEALSADPLLDNLGELSEPLKQLTSGDPKRMRGLLFLVAAVLALFSGLSLAPHWEKFLRYFNSVPFGTVDPIFENDISVYVFSLPVYRLIRGWLMSLVVFSFIGSGAIYWIKGMLRVAERSVSLSKTVKPHLYGLIIAGLLLKIWDYRLQMYDLLFSRQGLVFGAGYTDYHVQLVALWVMLIYMLGLALFVLSGIFSSKDRVLWLIIGLIVIVPLALIMQGFLPGIVQQMIVKPNELTKEEPFIQHNIEMTNEAYGLSEITVKPFSVEDTLRLEDLEDNQDTINNIRLWDARPLLSTYKQIQAIRPYYEFYNVDVDRYMIDGKMRQVMLAPRELEQAKLPEQAKTWVNLRLNYTHGYGVVMNPVNDVTREGLPELFIKDIPPVASIDLPLTNTAIYYGEKQTVFSDAAASDPRSRSTVGGLNDYVIVRTENPEFHYPAGDMNEYITYDGTGGVWMGSMFRKALFAWAFKDINILLTSSTTNESRVMFRRDIQERVRHIAPFLELDRDPYLVFSEGHLFWMQDAYTMTDRYPYSEPVSFNGQAVNYIRNSVKIVVDAYHGSVAFYLVDENDPLAKTFQNIFPDLLRPFSEMPDGLKAHVRYPKDLFTVQLFQYNTYHMKDPKVFYNKEDLWTVPNENYGGETVQMEPYYIQMRLPGEEQMEFILMNPLTPKNKDNMIAWFAARSDVPYYGELLVYQFPKEKLIYGPSQIEARIDQNTTISQQFSLWDQRGSSVIRGNLLVIPIDNSILYVEPVYLRAAQRDLPELKRVIASYGGNVAMGMDLQEALEAAFADKMTSVEQELVERLPLDEIESEEQLQEAVQRLNDHFTTARQHLADGNWTQYGQEMDKAEELIRRLQQQYGQPQDE